MQDALLQSYRALHTTLQTILLAVGIGLAVIPLSLGESPFARFGAIAACGFLLTCWALHRYAGRVMRKVVVERGEDVSYWHLLIIMAEQKMPAHRRFFTGFKIHQQARRRDVDHLKNLFLATQTITVDQATELIGRGLGHTRRVVDSQLFDWIERAWFLLLMVAVGTTVWRFWP